MRCMTKRRLAAMGLGAALSVALAAVGSPAQAADEARVLGGDAPGAIPGRYIVVLKGEPVRGARAQADVGTAARSLMKRHGGAVGRVYSAALRGFSARMSRAQAERLAADPKVRHVEQDGTAHATGTQPNPPSWGLDRIDGTSDDSYTYPNVGAGATVYVIDTGIRMTHDTFEGRAVSGYDFVDDDPNASDCHGHGTHVSGTAGGEEYGVAKDVKLVAVRVLDCMGSAPWSDVIAGVDWVTDNASGPSVANMSLGGGANSSVDQAVRNSIAAGVSYSLAAGNSSADACNTSPARVAEAITVGATDQSDNRSSFSNYGTCLDLFAPGSSIVSASHTSDTGSTTMSGTSMAAPHVAGAAAIYLSSHQSASPQQVRDAIVAAADEGVVGNPGSGSPNRLLNVTGLGGDEPPPPGDPEARFTADCSTTEPTCDFDASESSDSDGQIESYAWKFGDGKTGSGVTPSHTYAEPGTYTVTLTVTDNDGNTDSAQKTVTAGDDEPPGDGSPPTASFTVSCWYEDCDFDASASSDPDGDIASYAWEFGDGSTGTGVRASHRYSSEPADYTAKLTVTDRAGNTATATHWVKCYPHGSRALCFQQD